VQHNDSRKRACAIRLGQIALYAVARTEHAARNELLRGALSNSTRSRGAARLTADAWGNGVSSLNVCGYNNCSHKVYYGIFLCSIRSDT
jgi:hypothetical protein